MDKIPNEILVSIIDLLYVDQIIICKQVNKRWNQLIERFIKLNHLIIIDNEFPLLNRWSFSNDYICDYKYKIINKRLSSLYLKSNQMFSKIKKLFIFKRKLKTNSLNHLNELECLEISNCIFFKKGNLNLPNLKELSIECSRINKNVLCIDCSQLNKLRLTNNSPNFNKKIINKETIKFFYTDYFDRELIKFTNLEYLIISYQYFDQNILINLPNLKELHLFCTEIESLESYQNLKTILKRQHLKMYFFGIDSDVFPLDDNLDHFLCMNNFQSELDKLNSNFYLKYYSNLSNLIYNIKTINYNEINTVNYGIAKNDLIKRMLNLEELKLTEGDVNLDEFYDLLKKLKYIKILNITRSTIDEHFFNQILPAYCPRIEKLIIQNINNLNLNFILKLEDIQILEIEQNLNSDLIIEMFNRFNHLKCLKFNFNGIIIITIYDRKNFKLKFDNFRNMYDNIDDLLKCLNNFKLNNKIIFDLDYNLDNFVFN